jgi:hypothetical protein
MLDDQFMWPLVRQARMGLADPELVMAGWGEYKGDVLVADIQREKGLGAREAEEELRAWVATHGGQLRVETHPRHRPIGSLMPTAGSGGTSLIVLLADDEIPAE